MKERWRASVAKAFPQGYLEGFPGYPLLGEELAAAEARGGKPWKLRLALVTTFPPELLEALLEDVEEIRLDGSAEVSGLRGDREVYDERSAGTGVWTLGERDELTDGLLAVRRTTWREKERVRVEHEVAPDGRILRNLAWLRSRPEDGRWVVSSSRGAKGEAEELIVDTLAYWTGAVAGVDVLEVSQQPDEGFESLWNRLCAVRLLRHEADLAAPADALAGAGFFASCSVESVNG